MILRFADCELDLAAHRLTRGGAPVHVEPQVFDLLKVLAASGGDLLTYDALIQSVWNGRIISDSAMAARISAARSAVGDNGRAQRIIRTVPRRGIQLAVPVTGVQGGLARSPESPRQSIHFARSVDGVSIAYAVSGEGPPLLRGSHWLSHLEHDWTSPVWRPLLDRLGRGRRLVRYDPRGTGLSDRRLGNADLDTFVADLVAVADAAGLHRFPIFAVSQSVPIALKFAALHPDRVSRMVLLNGFARMIDARQSAEANAALLAMIRSGWGKADSPFMAAFATVFMPRSEPAELNSLVEMQALSASAETAADLRKAIGAIDVVEYLDRVAVPTLVLHATGDAVQPLDEGRFLALTIPGAEFHQVDSPNHVPTPSDPAFAEILDATDRFLALEDQLPQKPTSSS